MRCAGREQRTVCVQTQGRFRVRKAGNLRGVKRDGCTLRLDGARDVDESIRIEWGPDLVAPELAHRACGCNRTSRRNVVAMPVEREGNENGGGPAILDDPTERFCKIRPARHALIVQTEGDEVGDAERAGCVARLFLALRIAR